MGLPKIEIIFKSLAATAIKRGERGVVALVLDDTVPDVTPVEMFGVNEIPEEFTNFNKEQILLAFRGGVNPPRKVIAYVRSTSAENYNEAMTYLETIKWDYLAIPGIDAADVDLIATWIKGLRDNKDMGVKAVLPNCDADHEGIINFTTNDIKVGSKTYTAAEYCSRIAGLAAGCPLTMSLTYQVLPEVDDVPHLTTEQFDQAIDGGELVLMHDGEKVKIARGVNSLVTVAGNKGEEWKKILIIDKMDLWKSDVKGTIADSYLGKYPNTYDNKMLLVSAIQAYNDEWVLERLLDGSLPEYNQVGIDIERQRIFLKGLGEPVDEMDEQQIKMANTKDKVFIATNLKFVDAMEDFVVNVEI